MREIRSLVISCWRPYGSQGGAPLRNSQNVTGLRALGPVDVLTIGRHEDPLQPPGVRRWIYFEKEHRQRSLPGSWLLEPDYHPLIDGFYHAGAAAFLEESIAAKAYDLVVIEQIACTSYLPLVKKGGMPVVFDDHNVEAPLRLTLDRQHNGRSGSDLTLQAARRNVRHWIHGRRMATLERRALRMPDMVWACSAVDAKELLRLYAPCAPVRVVPNAVDISALASARAGRATRPGAPVELVYVGSYDYHPNEEAALRLVREVMPTLRARGTATRVTLVGRRPTPAMYAAASSDPDVTVTGAVDSIVPYLSGAAIMALPIMIGSGTRFKILEAFAAECPVVSTSKGGRRDRCRRRDPPPVARNARGICGRGRRPPGGPTHNGANDCVCLCLGTEPLFVGGRGAGHCEEPGGDCSVTALTVRVCRRIGFRLQKIEELELNAAVLERVQKTVREIPRYFLFLLRPALRSPSSSRKKPSDRRHVVSAPSIEIFLQGPRVETPLQGDRLARGIRS